MEISLSEFHDMTLITDKPNLLGIADRLAYGSGPISNDGDKLTSDFGLLY